MMNTNSPDDLLQFKDFSNTPGTSSPPQINVNSPSHSVGSSSGRRDPLSELIYDMSNASKSGNNMTAGGPDGNGDGNNASNSGKVSFLTIEYYRQFFDVDTFMVLDRIANSMIPRRAPVDYLRTTIEQNPDLYGPFWISVTLIFCMAISGNIFSYIIWARDDIHWHYNFKLVSYAATAIFIYANLVPLALWAIFKYTLKPIEEGHETQNANYTPSLLALLCVFGYSLSIYVPVSILWAIPVLILKLLLVFIGGGLSGTILIAVLRPALRNSRLSLIILINILALHMILAGAFLLLFFHIPHNVAKELPTPQAQSLKAVTSSLVKMVLNSTVAGDIQH